MRRFVERPRFLFATLLSLSLLQQITFYSSLSIEANGFYHLPAGIIGRNTSIPASFVPERESVSACLLVSDDNHYLIEWLAYHYHVLPLGHVIVAVDSKSRTSPSKIFDRWRDRIKIEEWNETHYIPDRFYRRSYNGERYNEHLDRQRLFNLECLRHLKRLDKSWVLMTDSDEYTRINSQLWKARDEGAEDAAKVIPPIEEPGFMLKFLNRLLRKNDTFVNTKTPCLSIVRHQFNVKESPFDKVNAEVPAGFNASSFQTLRWRHCKFKNYIVKSKVWDKDCDLKRNLPGKTMINLAGLQLQDLYLPGDDGNPHRPLASVCPRVWTPEDKSPLVAHHYMGTFDQWAYRSDSRGLAGRRARYEFLNESAGVEENDDLRPWLKAFVANVGPSEASRLLEGVGQLEPLPFDETLQQQQEPSKSAFEQKFLVGDAVEVKYGKRWKLLEVFKVHDSGLYDIFTRVCLPDVGVSPDRLQNHNANSSKSIDY